MKEQRKYALKKKKSCHLHLHKQSNNPKYFARENKATHVNELNTV